MRRITIYLGLLLFGFTVLAQAQPDPRDSIIIESKSVSAGWNGGFPGDTAAYVYLKVFITNKDSLTEVSLALIEQSVSGGAYITLGAPRTFDGVVNRFTNTLGQKVANFSRYNNSSPDSFRVAGFFDPLDQNTIEPPNSVRKLLWELKFDTARGIGAVELDTGTVVQRTFFTNTIPVDVPVNFVKSTITVNLKGDLNLDGEVRPSDVVLELMCVYLGQIPPAGQSACDLNCDGQVTAADVAVMLNFKYLTGVWPC